MADCIENESRETIKQSKEHRVKPTDRQVGGYHYKKYKIQPIEFAMANNLNACQTLVLRYLLRYKDKNGLEDLRKAIHCIQILMELEYGETE